jgi:hypothetical protein
MMSTTSRRGRQRFALTISVLYLHNFSILAVLTFHAGKHATLTDVIELQRNKTSGPE